MTKNIPPNEWRPSDGIILEENADYVIRCQSNILVTAGPGAGKTELLAQKAGYLFRTNLCVEPRKILAISFKKDAAENLKKRVITRYGTEYGSRFSSMTFDAFSKRTLDHFHYAIPEEFRPNSDYVVNDDIIIKLAFIKAGYNNPLGLSPSKLKMQHDKILSSVTLPLDNSLGANVWRILLKGSNGNPACLSFKMICILADHIVRTNVKIQKATQWTYVHVFLDEFQDTTHLQYKLVRACFENSPSTITAVGDSKQRIMVWAGALRSIFNDYSVDFCATRKQLVMNHRSAPKLVQLQRMMYQSLNEKPVDIKTSPKWNEYDGEIRLLLSPNETSEAEYIADDIYEKYQAGTRIDDISILCKQVPANYTDTIIQKLYDHGIRARIETDYQDLIKEPVILLLVNCIRLAIGRRSTQCWAYINEASDSLFGEIKAGEYEEYCLRQDSIIEELNVLQAQLLKCGSKESFDYIIDTLVEYWGNERIFAAFPIYAHGNYFSTLVSQFSELMWYEYELSDSDWLQSADGFLGLNSIPIMTIHKSKGLEYDAVYFIGLEDSAFWNFRNQPDEDRCAFFVGLSRAKVHSCFYIL